MGYDPARLLSAADVQQVAAALADLPPEEFGKRFDGQKLYDQMVYPFGNAPATPDKKEWLERVYREVREFYQRADVRSDAVLIWIESWRRPQQVHRQRPREAEDGGVILGIDTDPRAVGHAATSQRQRPS